MTRKAPQARSGTLEGEQRSAQEEGVVDGGALGGGSPGDRDDGRVQVRAFFVWGTATYLITTLGVLLLSMRRTGGRLVYVIDDPAIHLSVAENLANHGTWGVVPGEFQSASSSPLWTLLLAAWARVVPGSNMVAPLVLNLAAGIAVIGALALTQRLLRPGRRQPLDAVAVAALVTVILFLPGLALTGMEHTLQIALLLPAVILFHRATTGQHVWGPQWLPYVLLALATLTRFETAFVAVGLAVAFLVVDTGPVARAGSSSGHTALGDLRSRWMQPALVLASSAVPLAGFALFNRLMGQGFVPNALLAKGSGMRDASVTGLSNALARLGSDALVAGLTGVALVALLVLGLRRTSWSFPAVVLCVTVAFHVLLARMGWYERYQAYLIALGVYVAMCLLAERLAVSSSMRMRRWLVPGLVAVALLFTGHKAAGTFNAGKAVNETYSQRFQVARFVERYYDGEPIATGELGYVSLAHEGPLTDVFGLGDYEVLQEWQRTGERPEVGFWRELAERRGFEVVAVYPLTLFGDTPDEWIHVGDWDMDRWVTTAPSDVFQFYATVPEAVGPLRQNLEVFEPKLPDGVTLELNELAEFRADEMLQGAG